MSAVVMEKETELVEDVSIGMEAENEEQSAEMAADVVRLTAAIVDVVNVEYATVEEDVTQAGGIAVVELGTVAAPEAKVEINEEDEGAVENADAAPPAEKLVVAEQAVVETE